MRRGWSAGRWHLGLYRCSETQGSIAHSDGTRAGVLAALPETRIEDGLVGDFVPYRAIDSDEALVAAVLGR